MILKFKINEKTGLLCVPSELRNLGYTGEVSVIPNEFTVVMLKPGASTKALIASLDHVKQVLLLIEKFKEPEQEILSNVG